jgi:hypothetical protein
MEHEVEGRIYKISTINAVQQFHITRRLAPVIGKFSALRGNPRDLSKDPEKILQAIGIVADALARLSDFDADYCLFGLLKSVTRKQSNGLGWAPITTESSLMFDDITMPTMLKLAWFSMQLNFASFLDALPSALPEDNQKPNA